MSGFKVESTRRVRRVLRTMLALDHFTFFANLALHMPILEDRKRQTIGADGRNIYFNPEWVAKASNDEIRERLCGCVLKCGLKHHTRRGDRDYERWQTASDLVTRPLLHEAGVIDDAQAEGGLQMSIEQAYAQLPEPPEQPGDEGDGDEDAGGGEDDQQQDAGGDDQQPSDEDAGGESDGDQDGEGDDADQGPPSYDPGLGEAMDSPARDEQERGEGGAGEEESDDQPESDGSAGGGTGAGEDEDEDADGTGSGDGDQPSDGDQANGEAGGDAGDGAQEDAEPGAAGQATTDPLQAEEQQWDERMQQAMAFAKSAGSMPGAIKEAIDSAHSAQVDWENELRRYMTDFALTDYTWSRPNPRYVDEDLYLPDLQGESMDRMVFVIDTSLSMNAHELALIWGEVRSGAEELRPLELIVIQCDEQVKRVDRYDSADLPETLDAQGRGGTDFRPAFEWIDRELAEPPAVVMYMTDCRPNGLVYPDEPSWPVLWICTDPNIADYPEAQPPYGHRIDFEATP